MTEQESTLLDAVTELARLAGTVALEHFGTRLEVETKSDGSPVTLADRAAEQAARTWLAKRFPEDDIVGEEFGVTASHARRRWLIDPIDGTKTFVRGVPLWGSLVAVAEGAEVLAGAIYCPAVGELVAAAVGQGCWWNGTRCSVSSVGDLARAAVLTSDDRFPGRDARRARWTDLTRRAAVVRTWGDCYGYMLVATGRADAMVDDAMADWDAAPLLPIIREAGGVFTDWRGNETAFGGDAVATNAALAVEVRSLLGVRSGAVVEARSHA